MNRVFLRHLVVWFFCLAAAPLAIAQTSEELNEEGDATASQPVSNPAHNLAELRVAMVASAVKGIISYVRWPAQADRSQLCVVGPTEYADGLIDSNHIQDTSTETIKVRRVLLTELTAGSALGCATLYIGKLDRADQIALLQKMVGEPILTISENVAQCNNGSLFCLRIDDERVGFEVNLDSVARSGLRVNPQVLKLGRAAGAN